MVENKKVIEINPVTRLEGHAKIEIFLNEEGNVKDAFFQVVEFRGIERFLRGRPIEEMPHITARLCGVCPWAHHLAATKASDAVYHVDPPSPAKKLRELGYMAHFVHSHTAHFYALAGPDFVVGPTAPPAERNIFGVINKVGLELGGAVIRNRAYAQDIQEIIGGLGTHPVFGLPGGCSKGITAEERDKIAEMGKSILEFGKVTQQVFNDVVLENSSYVDLITGDIYKQPTYHMGLVDADDKVTFYDGTVKVIDPEGKEHSRFATNEYLDNIAEKVMPWTYLKFPYLRKVGWKGLTEGMDSGVMRVAPLARLNVSSGMATPLAQEQFEKFYSILPRPCHSTLAMHWARVIELLYAAERLGELVADEEILSPDVHTIPTAVPDEGIGIVEAPRGTLVHHYKTDAHGIVQDANLIVATGHNNAIMCMGIKRAAEKLIKNFEVDQGICNMIEMTFRAYDPCFACSTHALGQMVMEINIRDDAGSVIERIER